QRGVRLAPSDNVAALRKRPPKPPNATTTDKVLYLLDYLPPEHTPEAEENRRRERYAVLSALNTAGYVPTEPDRLHYVQFGDPSDSKDTPDPKFGARAWKPVGRRIRIPYEWATWDPDLEDSPAKDGYWAVCVLWVSPPPEA